MSVEASQTEDEWKIDFSNLEANNYVRPNAGACVIVREEIQGEMIETVFLTVDRQYFRVKEFGKPAKCERHTMSEKLNEARESEAMGAKLGAYPHSDLDLEGAEEFIEDTFELEAEEPSAGYGLSREELDNQEDEHLEVASAAADSSEEHGGGWN